MRARCTVHDLTVDRGPHRVLHGVNATVEPEQVVALTGANGAGKTTLVECMAGLIPASVGSVTWSALEAPAGPPEALRALCLQSGGLPRQRTVEDFLHLMARLYGSSRTPAQALAQVGLDGLQRRLIKNLSGGQSTRLRVAVAWITGAPALLLDEPTSGLDAESTEAIRTLVRRHRAEGGSVVLVTHVFADVMECADSLWVLRNGTLTQTEVGPRQATVTFATSLSREQLEQSLPLDHVLTQHTESSGACLWSVRGPLAHDPQLISVLTSVALRNDRTIGDWHVSTPEDWWNEITGVRHE